MITAIAAAAVLADLLAALELLAAGVRPAAPTRTSCSPSSPPRPSSPACSWSADLVLAVIAAATVLADQLAARELLAAGVRPCRAHAAVALLDRRRRRRWSRLQHAIA